MKKVNWQVFELEALANKLGLGLGLAIVLLGFGVMLLVKPNLALKQTLVAQERHLKKEFKEKYQLASNLYAYKQALEVQQKSFDTLLALLPSQNEMPGLLEELSKTGKSQGLTLSYFAPQKELSHDFYVELPIKMTVTGSYFQLAHFLGSVSAINRVLSVHELRIEKSMTHDLIMTITAKLYRRRTA